MILYFAFLQRINDIVYRVATLLADGFDNVAYFVFAHNLHFVAVAAPGLKGRGG